MDLHIFYLKPNFLMVSSNFKYHFSRFVSVHKLVSLVCKPCLPMRFDYEAYRLTHTDSCKSPLRKGNSFIGNGTQDRTELPRPMIILIESLTDS